MGGAAAGEPFRSHPSTSIIDSPELFSVRYGGLTYGAVWLGGNRAVGVAAGGFAVLTY